MRALWVEDQSVIADAIELWLGVAMPELAVDKARSLSEVCQHAAGQVYDIVLLDWWLDPRTDGSRAIAALRDAGCTAPVLVFSNDERHEVMLKAREAGAAAYLHKSAESEVVEKTIRFVLGGGVQRLPARSAANGLEAGASLPALDVRDVFPELTPRQADVLRKLMTGKSDKQIARHLGLSDTTVKTHVRAILQTLGVHSRGEAAYAARARGAGEA
jgi:two-component system, NarL family, nitrate/nitrite response regulator NarL